MIPYALFFRNHDLTRNCTGCSSDWGSEEDLHFGGSHTSQKVTVIGGYHTLTIGQNTASTAAAQTAAWVSNHGTGFCQCKKCSVCQSLLVDLTAGRSHDQFGERSHFFAFQYSGCALKILRRPLVQEPINT